MLRNRRFNALLLATLVCAANLVYSAKEARAAETCDPNACNSMCLNGDACEARGCAGCSCYVTVGGGACSSW